MNKPNLDFMPTDVDELNAAAKKLAEQFLGRTVAAVEEVVQQFFNEPSVDELGDFYFAIKTRAYSSTPQAFQTFLRMLDDAKNVRSWLKGIDIDLSPPKQNFYVGNALFKAGTLDVDLNRPRDSLMNIHAGNVFDTQGSVDVALSHPTDSLMCVHVGSPFVVGGHVLIDSVDKPVVIRENPIADLAIANVAISRGDNLHLLPEFDVLKIFFKFPTGIRRSITLNHPREDLTASQIKAVGDYAVEHDLLLDRDDDSADDAPKAKLIKKVVRTLI